MDHRTQVSEQIDYVARTLARLGVRSSDVEDLTQEVLIVAIRRAESFDSARRIEPWLFGIARNVARDFRRLVRHRIEQSDDGTVAARAEGDSPAEHANLRQRAVLLRKVVADLDETLQELIVLHDLDEIPMAEVAAFLKIPIDTAYARLRRGRAAVRTQLADLGGSHGLD